MDVTQTNPGSSETITSGLNIHRLSPTERELRDDFAKLAMEHFTWSSADSGAPEIESDAKACYAIANAMILARRAD